MANIKAIGALSTGALLTVGAGYTLVKIKTFSDKTTADQVLDGLSREEYARTVELAKGTRFAALDKNIEEVVEQIEETRADGTTMIREVSHYVHIPTDCKVVVADETLEPREGEWKYDVEGLYAPLKQYDAIVAAKTRLKKGLAIGAGTVGLGMLAAGAVLITKKPMPVSGILEATRKTLPIAIPVLATGAMISVVVTTVKITTYVSNKHDDQEWGSLSNLGKFVDVVRHNAVPITTTLVLGSLTGGAYAMNQVNQKNIINTLGATITEYVSKTAKKVSVPLTEEQEMLALDECKDQPKDKRKEYLEEKLRMNCEGKYMEFMHDSVDFVADDIDYLEVQTDESINRINNLAYQQGWIALNQVRNELGFQNQDQLGHVTGWNGCPIISTGYAADRPKSTDTFYVSWSKPEVLPQYRSSSLGR